jgi:uncharacterized protein (DUF924 family)
VIERYTALYEEAQAKKTLTVQVLERFYKIAKVHYNSVMLFGRYPERNQYLGRTTTLEREDLRNLRSTRTSVANPLYYATSTNIQSSHNMG